MTRLRTLPTILLLSLVLTSACGERDDCLAGSCADLQVCAPIAFSCESGDGGFVRVSTVAERGAGIPGPRAQGVDREDRDELPQRDVRDHAERERVEAALRSG